MTCCAYSCTQYGLHTQYMLLTHADDLLCLQLYTVRSAYTVHAFNPCWWLAVPTAAHSTVSIHSTCLWPMMMACCAYSCTQYSFHTQYMLLTHDDDLLCLQLHTVRSAHSTYLWPMMMTCCAYSCTQYGLHTHHMLVTHDDNLLCLQLHTVHACDPCWWLAVPTAAHSTVCAQYMLVTHANDLLCLQLHTVRSPYSIHAFNPCWWLAVPTAAHSTVCIHSTCFWPMLMTCCMYSCTQHGLHTRYMLLTHADCLLCLQLHTLAFLFFSQF